jgi:hypothetical protein
MVVNMKKLLLLALMGGLGACTVSETVSLGVGVDSQPTQTTKHMSLVKPTYYTMQTGCLVWVPNLEHYQNVAIKTCADKGMTPVDAGITNYRECKADASGTPLYSYTVTFSCQPKQGK